MRKMASGIVYVILFPNGKRYVGQTTQRLIERMWRHWHPKKQEINLPVHCAMQKYGQENVRVEKVFTLKCTQEYLNLIEQRTIKHYSTMVPNGYNLKEGGSRGRHSEETKAKLSAANKGKHLSEETKAKISQTLRGSHCSEHTKAKISAALKGKPLSEEHKAKISAANRGRHHSEETKVQISASNKGKHNCSDEARSKMSLARKGGIPWIKGKHHSEETKIKISMARTGTHRSEETKAKISVARRKRRVL